jgi:membrane-associated phospholipid phosphatase
VPGHYGGPAIRVFLLAVFAVSTVAAETSSDRVGTKQAAYDFDDEHDCTYCRLSPGRLGVRRGLHWHAHWNRVGVPEYVLAPVLSALGAALTFWVQPASDANWTGPALFDAPARDALTITSDALLWGSVAHTMIVDPLVVAWAARGSSEVAWQMTVINAQAYALTLSINALTKRLVERERPWGDVCTADPDSARCERRGRYESFYSGHAALTATSAGLTCAHHTQLKLYGNELADSLTCVGALAFTAATGALRVSSDNHWATDVLVGHVVGYATGYFIPTLRFYKEFRVKPEPDEHATILVLPYVGSGTTGIAAHASW